MSDTKPEVVCDIDIHKCERLAKELGGNPAFFAEFPIGRKRCEWIDPYLGFVRIDTPEMRDKFMTVGQLEEMFPGLKCSEPTNE